MATAAQRRAARNARNAKKRKSSGLHGLSITKGFTTKNMTNSLKDAGMFALGMVLGKDVVSQLAKLVPEKTPAMIKQYLPVLAQAIGGIVVAQQKVAGVDLKYLGHGLLAGAILDGIKEVSGKDVANTGLLGGLGSALKGLGLGGSYAPLSETMHRALQQEVNSDFAYAGVGKIAY